MNIASVRLNDKPVVLRNNRGQDHLWVGFQLQGTQSSRDAIGAKLTLHAGSRKFVRWVTGGGSYLSSHDKRVLFGLGGEVKPSTVSVEIRWPSGQTQTVSDLQPGRYYKVVESVPQTKR